MDDPDADATYVPSPSSSGDEYESGDVEENIFVSKSGKSYHILSSSCNVHSADNVVPTENQLLVESTRNQNDIEPQIAIVPTSNNKNITCLLYTSRCV